MDKERTRAATLVKDGCYHELLMNLENAKLVEVSETLPVEVNGPFAVANNEGRQRLIVDARWGDRHSEELADPCLPNPGSLAQLHVVAQEPLVLGKLVIDTFFYQLELPAQLSPYFELRPIRRNEKLVYYRMKLLPMDWNHSVFLAQHLHRFLAF